VRGLSVFTILKNDGRVGTVVSAFNQTFELIAKYAKTYDYMERRFLMMMVDPNMEDHHFELNIQQSVSADMMRSRREWSTAFNAELLTFIEANPHLNLTAIEAKKLFLQLSMGLLPCPQPSPESPGGSGGS
jgi:hypothetical protein